MIGILKKDFGWSEILEQEGLLYEVLNIIPNDYHYPIIVNRELRAEEIQKLKKMILDGLCILVEFPVLVQLSENQKYRFGRINYLFNDSSDIFNNIIAIDLYLSGYITNPSVIQRRLGKGFIIGLPFNINNALLDCRKERKPFFYTSRKYPNEVVAKVSKGAVRKLVINCVRKLFQMMNLYYCHLWYYPNKLTTSFAFRIDTDFGDADALRATYDLEENVNLKFTYFLNTAVHTNYNKSKDIQIHCYHHKVFRDYKRNFENIKQAKSILTNNGINPIGFVSPFGLWNKNLQKAIEDCEIEYSSEFCLAYDSLPFYPIIDNRRSKALQIPVHPICISRLLHAGLSKNQCIDYYLKYFIKQYQTNEPIFIYDHPHRVAQFNKIFYEVIMHAKDLSNIWFTSITEFYNWWKTRLEVLNHSFWKIEKNSNLQIITPNNDERLFLHIITPDQNEVFLKLEQNNYDLQKFTFQKIIPNKVNKLDIDNYLRLKATTTKFSIVFYQIIDKILEKLKLNFIR